MIHVAVLMKPYLDLILAGEKSVECRLTRDQRDPFERLEPGERIYFKQSAGPYRATAVADHVLFESDLTPRRVAGLKRDYNELIRGDDQFWQWKRDARFATLIWLRDVRPTTDGPAVRPLQGVAWLCLEEDPAWRRVDTPPPSSNAIAPLHSATSDGRSFSIEITAGNIRNNTLYVTECAERFPDWAFGGLTKSQAANPITLIFHDGPTVATDIVGPRKLLRTRVWGKWFGRHGARPGDRVVFRPADDSTYFVGLARGTGQPPRRRRRLDPSRQSGR